jgi:crotonobetaine/carnitine-CoA ligase
LTLTTPADRAEQQMGPAFRELARGECVLANILRRAADRFGDRHFARLPGGDITFSGTVELAARAASVLSGLGVGPGERVAILIGNRIEFIACVWGAGWSGALGVPINTALIGARLSAQLIHADTAVLVVESSKMEDLAAIAPKLVGTRHIVVVGDGDFPRWPGPAFHRWDDLFAQGGVAAPVDARFSDPLMIMYTSGTTGASKGVVISHYHYWCYAAPNVDNHRWGPGDHLYTPMPLCHASAHMALLVPGLIAGAQVTICDRFSPSRFWREIAEAGATHVTIIGAAGAILAQRPPSSEERGHRLRTIACSPPPTDIRDFEQRFGARVLWQAYGMTEGYFCHRTLDQPERARTSIGRASPIFSVEVLDENDEVLAHDGVSVGEIAVRPILPYSMITEYFRNPDATAAAFRNLWFHTGDLGLVDPDGSIHLRGRKKDSIRRRGENVSAAELESEIMAHPAVKLAAAFAVPSELGEDDIKVDLVLADGATLAPAALIEWIEQRLPAFMIPRYLQYRDELPLTPSQRIEKYRLQQEGVTAADYDGGARRPKKVRR